MGDEWLEVTQGPAAGDRLEVGLELAVGRAQPGQADLARDPQVSREHARFWRAAGGHLIVEDLGSANGTFVNGERIDRPAVLSVGDAVQLGGTTLVVHGGEQPLPSPPSSTQPTRVRSGPRPGLKADAPQDDRVTRGVGPSGGPAARFEAAKRRLPRPLSLLGGLLLVAVVGLSVALATRGGGTSGAVLHNTTVVDPLFPVIAREFSGQIATFKSSSTRPAVRATIDWGDGTAPTRGTIGPLTASGAGTYTRSVHGSHRYTRVATYAVTVTVTATEADMDSASNLAVVTNCLYETNPTFARSVDLGPVSGQVFIRLPASGSFVPLTTPREIPVGSQLDATHGSLVVMAATATAGKLQAGEFDGDLFQINQAQTLGGLVDLKLHAASTAGCVATQPSRSLALLHASVNGSFGTQGKYSAATVRGTEWTTTEQCNGTLTRVQRGVVHVRNLRTGQTTVVPVGQSYLAASR